MGAKNDDRRREYRKHWMRRHRAARPLFSLAQINRRLEELGFPQSADDHQKPAIVSLSDPAIAAAVDQAEYEEWRMSA